MLHMMRKRALGLSLIISRPAPATNINISSAFKARQLCGSLKSFLETHIYTIREYALTIEQEGVDARARFNFYLKPILSQQ